jgi:hypothetical protein
MACTTTPSVHPPPTAYNLGFGHYVLAIYHTWILVTHVADCDFMASGSKGNPGGEWACPSSVNAPSNRFGQRADASPQAGPLADITVQTIRYIILGIRRVRCAGSGLCLLLPSSDNELIGRF